MRYFLLFIDWQTAFDRVPHDVIIELLKSLNASERTIRVVHIFLYCSTFSLDGKRVQKIEKGCP
jgi:hypothetical protein